MKIDKKDIIGLSERITVLSSKKQKTLLARIDTGAIISSVDAKLALELGLGPIKKTRRVKNANGIRTRPVVKCSFKIRGKKYTTDVTLADRKNLKFRVLIGQNILKKTKLMIDPRK